MLVNWKTSLCGLVIAVSEMVPKYFPQLGPYMEIVAPMATILLGLVAKDRNVTGGTVPQTMEAEERTGPIASSPAIK